MASRVFITGIGGFVGCALAARLRADEAVAFQGLVRAGISGDEVIIGDLLEPETYRSALGHADVVVHLAAATGKLAPAEYQRVNVDGTRALLEACKVAGVKKIIFISTIAAGYADRAHYPYAETKLAAEGLVRESGLAFTILRPTLVLGDGAPIWATLQRIVKLPIIPLPQGRRAVRVQPVDVKDVARAIDIVLKEDRFTGETLDVGGPDPESFDSFLVAVRRATIGVKAPVMRAPLESIRALLALVEPVARPFLPVTAGQLALFANDSVVSPNWLMDRLRPGMPSLGLWLTDLTTPPGGGSAKPKVQGPDALLLKQECAVFAEYLTGLPPTTAAIEHYIAAVRAHSLPEDGALSDLDRATLRLARRSPWRTRWADAFCALLHRRGALRRRLIILTAILENQPPTNAIFEAPQSPGPVGAFFILAARGLEFALALVLGASVIFASRIPGIKGA